MLISETATVKWNNRNKQSYIDKGYIFTELGDEFEAKVSDLSMGSKSMVNVMCDYCGQIVNKTYLEYNKHHHALYGDCCVKCQPIKNKLVCLDKYGVDNGSKTQSSIDKIRQTSLEKYGVENPAQSEQARLKLSEANKRTMEIRLHKTIATNMERYGVPCALQASEVRDKIARTMQEKYGVLYPKQSEEIKRQEVARNREKYGVDYYCQTDECKEKIKSTNIEKYGVPWSLQNLDVRQKGMNTLLSNGNCPTSKQQLALSDILREIYDDCAVNMPCGANFLDCVIHVNGYPIDVEYDGKYWHQDAQRDRRRDEYVKSQGYKILRIRAVKSLPTKEQIKEAIDCLVKGKHSFKMIELDI